MPKAGQKYGPLTILGQAQKGYWRCRCTCGNESVIAGRKLIDAMRSPKQPCCKTPRITPALFDDDNDEANYAVTNFELQQLIPNAYVVDFNVNC